MLYLACKKYRVTGSKSLVVLSLVSHGCSGKALYPSRRESLVSLFLHDSYFNYHYLVPRKCSGESGFREGQGKQVQSGAVFTLSAVYVCHGPLIMPLMIVTSECCQLIPSDRVSPRTSFARCSQKVKAADTHSPLSGQTPSERRYSRRLPRNQGYMATEHFNMHCKAELAHRTDRMNHYDF